MEKRKLEICPPSSVWKKLDDYSNHYTKNLSLELIDIYCRLVAMEFETKEKCK